MNPKLIVVPLALAAILSGGYYVDWARAQRQSVLSGFFENQPTQVSSRLGGRVVRILVKEGEAVKAGQLLVEFEDKSSQAAYEAEVHAAGQAEQQSLETARGSRAEDIARQEGVVREAQATLDELRNGPRPEEVRVARAKLAEARDVYRKAVNGSRPEEIAAARAAANVALERYRQAQRGLTPEERAQLKARLDSAAAAERLAKTDLDRFQYLYDNGAVAKQELDRDRTAYVQAVAARQDAEEAYRRAQEGTPAEELAQARAASRQADAELELAVRGTRREDVDAARHEMAAAQQNLELLLAGTRPEEIRAAAARLDQARSALLALRNGNRPEDVARAALAAQQAKAQAKSTLANLKERRVYAPIDGIVDRVLIADGDLVQPGAPVIQMSDPTDTWLRVYLPEADLPKVAVGDPAELVFDGIPAPIQGVVESIATAGEFTPANLQSPDERAKQVFGIRIRLAKPDPRVKAGMYVSVKRVGRWP